jgi:antitoxin component HigA of HigAB toxin-antitoxin module
MKNEMNFDQAINEVEKLIQNTSFEIDYSECDEKDEFVYVVLKIKSTNE